MTVTRFRGAAATMLFRTSRRRDSGLAGVGNCYKKWGKRLFRRIHLVSLACLRGIIVPPQPDHLLGKLGRSMRGVVCAFTEAEVKVIFLELECGCKPKIRQWPVAVTHVQVVRSVLQPDSN